jgi:hypothetical protein
MKIDQINISHNDYNNTLDHRTAVKNNEIQGGNFSFTPSQKSIAIIIIAGCIVLASIISIVVALLI